MSDDAWEFVSDIAVPFVLCLGLLPAMACFIVWLIG